MPAVKPGKAAFTFPSVKRISGPERFAERKDLAGVVDGLAPGVRHAIGKLLHEPPIHSSLQSVIVRRGRVFARTDQTEARDDAATASFRMVLRPIRQRRRRVGALSCR